VNEPNTTDPYNHPPGQAFCNQDVHAWFELSYCSYLVLQRTLLQEMPGAWQHAFVGLLEELRKAFPGAPGADYMVKLRDPEYSGRFVSDPLANYRHPNQRAIEEARTRD
jgi:hypothetical protein